MITLAYTSVYHHQTGDASSSPEEVTYTELISVVRYVRREKGRGHHVRENTKLVKLPTTQQHSTKQARMSCGGPPAGPHVAFTDICLGNLAKPDQKTLR